jgi:hypothetical protein
MGLLLGFLASVSLFQAITPLTLFILDFLFSFPFCSFPSFLSELFLRFLLRSFSFPFSSFFFFFLLGLRGNDREPNAMPFLALFLSFLGNQKEF